MTRQIRIPLFAAIAALLLLIGSRSASAQVVRAPYTPGPALSPWLNMYRSDPGPVGPYLSYVRPEQRLRQTLVDQQNRINQQAVELQAVRQRATALESRGALTPTGVSSTFMNYSHYYSFGRRR